jgi:hypothetical protein
MEVFASLLISTLLFLGPKNEDEAPSVDFNLSKY